MTTTMTSGADLRAQALHRPVIDVLAERVARGLLRWTEQRATRSAARPAKDWSKANERLARIDRTREGDAARIWSASPFGH